MITAEEANQKSEAFGSGDEVAHIYSRIDRASSFGHRMIATRNYTTVEEAQKLQTHFAGLGYEVVMEEWAGLYDEGTQYSLVIGW